MAPQVHNSLLQAAVVILHQRKLAGYKLHRSRAERPACQLHLRRGSLASALWTACVASGGVGTLRCFDPSQGCSVSPGPPAQHDSGWMVACFMSGHAHMQSHIDASSEAASFKLRGSSSEDGSQG